jgi:hypothetical protein
MKSQTIEKLKLNPCVYYAHSMKTYNSEKEFNETQFLRKNFSNVICPNKDLGNLGSMV